MECTSNDKINALMKEDKKIWTETHLLEILVSSVTPTVKLVDMVKC